MFTLVSGHMLADSLIPPWEWEGKLAECLRVWSRARVSELLVLGPRAKVFGGGG